MGRGGNIYFYIAIENERGREKERMREGKREVFVCFAVRHDSCERYKNGVMKMK